MAYMEILINEFGARAVAQLYEAHAPKTVKAVASVLPFTGPGIHAMRAGREVYTVIPSPATDPGAENQSVFPIPGDLYLYHQAEGWRAIDVPTRLRAEKDTTEFWHIAIWYGRDSFPISPIGIDPGNHFGEVEEGLPALAEACERIRFEGLQDVTFRLLD